MLAWLRPKHAFAQKVCAWLDSQPMLVARTVAEGLDWDALVDKTLVWVNVLYALQRDQPRASVPTISFQTERGTSPCRAFPALVYVQWLGIEAWTQAMYHVNNAQWNNPLELDKPPTPKHNMETSMHWCLRVARLIETLLVHFRQWMPVAHGSHGLEADCFRDLQTCLLSMAQVLCVLTKTDASTNATALVNSKCLMQSADYMDLVATNAVAIPLPMFDKTRKLVRQHACYRLGLIAYDQARYDVAYWCYGNLDFKRQPWPYGPDVLRQVESLKSMEKARALVRDDEEDSTKRSDGFKIFSMESTDRFHGVYREQMFPPQCARPAGEVASLIAFDAKTIIVAFKEEKDELWRELRFK